MKIQCYAYLLEGVGEVTLLYCDTTTLAYSSDVSWTSDQEVYTRALLHCTLQQLGCVSRLLNMTYVYRSRLSREASSFTVCDWLPRHHVVCVTYVLDLTASTARNCSVTVVPASQWIWCGPKSTNSIIHSFPRLWFDVILDFARVTNVLHYITLHAGDTNCEIYMWQWEPCT